MPSSYTTSLRFELQFTGENVNLWGEKLNAALARADDAVAGWLTKPLTGDYALTTANGVADEARRAMLKFTGTGAFTVTLPAVSKRYDVWNACTGELTLTNGSASVAVKPGEVVSLVTDGDAGLKLVLPTDYRGARITGVGAPTAGADAATKGYVDAAISSAGFSMGEFGVAITPGDSGKFLWNNGSVPGWATAVTAGAGLATVVGDTVTVTAASAADVRSGVDVSRAVTSAALIGSSARQVLTPATTVVFDTGSGYNATVTLSTSGHTIAAPSGAIFDGLPITLEIVNSSGGQLTVVWTAGSGGWDFGTLGLPSMPSSAGAALLVSAVYNSRTSKWDVLGYRKSAI